MPALTRFNKHMAEVVYGVHEGDTIRITKLDDPYNPKGSYEGREGVVEFIDSMGQLHGTWGGLAVIPGEDKFVIIKRSLDPMTPEEEIGGGPSPERQRRVAKREEEKWR